MQLRRLAALERQKIEDEYLAVIQLIAELRGHPRQPGPRVRDHQGRAGRAEEEVRRRAAHPRRRRRQPGDDRRGPHRRRGRRGDDLRPRLRQAPAGRDLPPPAPRRQGDHRPRHARGGRRRAPARREHPRLGPVLHRTAAASSAPRSTRCPTRAARPRASRSSTCRASRWNRARSRWPTITLKDFTAGSYLVLATRKGIIKKTPLEQFEKVRSSGIRAITIADDDELAWVDVSTGSGRRHHRHRQGQARPLRGVRGPGRWAATPRASSASGSPARATPSSG